MLIARIAKQSGPFWSVECDLIGAFTQGVGFEDAISMLEGLVNTMVRYEGHADFEARVTGVYRNEHDDSYDAYIEANEPALLVARVLKYQREVHGLSLADVTRRLGFSSRSSYASYEQGRAAPSLAKFRGLLAAIAPELAFVISARPQHDRRRSRAHRGRSAATSARGRSAPRVRGSSTRRPAESRTRRNTSRYR